MLNIKSTFPEEISHVKNNWSAIYGDDVIGVVLLNLDPFKQYIRRKINLLG